MAMTIGSIHTSGFTSPCTSELLLGFNNDKSNVTELALKLSQCPGFCEAVFKTSHLDLVGKGIRISTIIQGCLAVSIGAIFPILVYVTHTLSIRSLLARIPLLQDFKHKVRNINLFFTLCLVVAIKLQTTSRPVLETGFLSYIVSFEMYLTLTFYFGIMADQHINSDRLPGIFYAYMVMMFTLWYLGTKTSVPNQNFYKILANGCHTRSPAEVELSTGFDNSVSIAEQLDIQNYLGNETSASGRQALWWLLPFYLISGIVIVLLVLYQKKLPSWLRKHGEPFCWACVMTMFAGRVSLDCWRLGYQVQVVRVMKGKSFLPQNDWDFGQTTAVMIWLPVASEILSAIRRWKKPPVAAPEKHIPVVVEKAASASLPDEGQLELGSDKSGNLAVKVQHPVEHDIPGAE